MKNEMLLIAGEEEQRLDSVLNYGILDTPSNERLDRITRHAAALFDVPISLISIVDKNRIWFKSKFGVDITEIPREIGLCSNAITSNDLYIIENGFKDPRTKDHPWLALSEPYLFYAAVPLKVASGKNIGTLCIVDKKPRILSGEERDQLKALGMMVVDYLEMDFALDEAMRKFNERLRTTAHELKNALAPIPVWAEMINERTTDLESRQLLSYIRRSSERIHQLIDQHTAGISSAKSDADFRPIDLSSITARAATTNITLAAKKNQRLYLHIDDDIQIMGDDLRISEVVDNLVSNAIKYSDPGTALNIHLAKENDNAIMKIVDQGPGLSKDDFSNIFKPFSRLSAKPTAGEVSTGLGLSIVKQIVNDHKGKVWCQNNLPEKGATFIVELPAIDA